MVSDRIKNEPGFDVLADVMATLRFRGSVFFHSELAAPWGMSVDEDGVPRFHIALHGACYLGAEGMDAVKIEEMDIILLPRGSEHWIADAPGRDLVSTVQAGEACELGNPLFQHGAITNRIMCGVLEYYDGTAHPIFHALPPLIHFPHVHQADTLWNTVQLIDAEMLRTCSRRGVILDRLTEVLFLQLLEHHLNVSPESAGFIAALRDRRLRLALDLIHQNPAFDWDVGSLGKRVGMSKATLNRHFQDTVGVSPIAYLGNWRLTKAVHLLKCSSASLEQIAEMVGFASARTLSRAFKRELGLTPREMRDQG
jgi:AraC-like DNA-binding protein